MAANYGLDLHVFGTDAGLVQFIEPNIEQFALRENTLLTVRTEGSLHRYDAVEGKWTQTFSLSGPKSRGESLRPIRAWLSSTSTYFVVEAMAPLTTDAGQRVVRGLIRDGRSGLVTYEIDLIDDLRTAAGFGVLPSLGEVVVLAAPGMWDVGLVSCRSGSVLRTWSGPGSYRHTEFVLSPDTRRLYCSGALWAIAPEERIYDITPWLTPQLQRGEP